MTRPELLARAQAHLDATSRPQRRVLTMKHYRQAVAIVRQHRLATEAEILAAHRSRHGRPQVTA